MPTRPAKSFKPDTLMIPVIDNGVQLAVGIVA